MNLQQLEYLAAIIRCGSITGAASECHVTQQAVSNAIRSLEKELGIQLLVRTSSGVQASSECRKMSNSVRKVLEGCNEIKTLASLSAQAEGTIRLAIAKRSLAPKGPHPNSLDLEQFEAAHPAIRLEKYIAASDACYAMVEQNMADMAIAIGIKDPAKFDSVILSSKEAVIITSAQSAIASLGKTVSFKNLAMATFVPPPDLGNSMKQIFDICKHYGFNPEFYTSDLIDNNIMNTVMTHNLAHVVPIDAAEKYYHEAKEKGFDPVILNIAANERFSIDRRLIWLNNIKLSPAAELLKRYLEGLAEV